MRVFKSITVHHRNDEVTHATWALTNKIVWYRRSALRGLWYVCLRLLDLQNAVCAIEIRRRIRWLKDSVWCDVYLVVINISNSVDGLLSDCRALRICWLRKMTRHRPLLYHMVSWTGVFRDVNQRSSNIFAVNDLLKWNSFWEEHVFAPINKHFNEIYPGYIAHYLENIPRFNFYNLKHN